MSCLRRCALFLSCLLLLGIAALAGVVWFASDWLVRADPPARSDAIVVLSGDFQRVFHAILLNHFFEDDGASDVGTLTYVNEV